MPTSHLEYTKIWNVNKRGLFFTILLFPTYTLLPSMLQRFDLLGKKGIDNRNDVIIWTLQPPQLFNPVSSLSVSLSLSLYIYGVCIYIYIYIILKVWVVQWLPAMKMESVNRHQNLTWAIYFGFCVNTVGKGMNPLPTL